MYIVGIYFLFLILFFVVLGNVFGVGGGVVGIYTEILGTVRIVKDG